MLLLILLLPLQLQHGDEVMRELINLAGFFYLTSVGFLSTVRKLSNYTPDLISGKHNYRAMYSVYTRRLEAGEQFMETQPDFTRRHHRVFPVNETKRISSSVPKDLRASSKLFIGTISRFLELAGSLISNSQASASYPHITT